MLAKEVEQIRNEMQAAEEKSRKLQDLIEKNLQSALVREAEAQQKLLEEKDKAIERLQMEKEELNARIAQDLKVLQEPAGNLHKNIQGKKRRFGTFFGKKKEEKILITILKNREMSDEQKDFLIDCLEEGMDTQEIASFASPDLSVAIMKRLKELRKKER